MLSGSLRSRLRVIKELNRNGLATTTVAPHLIFLLTPIMTAFNRVRHFDRKFIVVQPYGGSFNQRLVNENNTVSFVSRCKGQFLNPPTTMDGGMFDMRTPNTSATTPQFSSHSPITGWWSVVDVTLVRILRSVHYGEIHWNQDNLICRGKQMISANLSSTTIKANCGCVSCVKQKFTDADIQTRSIPSNQPLRNDVESS